MPVELPRREWVCVLLPSPLLESVKHYGLSLDPDSRSVTMERLVRLGLSRLAVVEGRAAPKEQGDAS